jgi:hypothetical protein
VPADVKQAVLAGLAESDVAFEAAPDLCEMSARKDPDLVQIATGGPVRIAACFPRAVKWLFSAAGAPLPEEGVEILNMREQPAASVLQAILGESSR